MANEKTQSDQLDTSAAQAFERYLVPTIFGPWSRDLVDVARPVPGERVLDVGCGTGAAARYAAELVAPGGTVAAIDTDARMIAFARTLCPPGDVDWRVADVMALPFGDGAFDVVVGHQVLQFLKDKAGALREMRRVLAPGGRLVLGIFCGLALCPGHDAVARALEAHDVDPSGIRVPYAYDDAMAIGDVIQQAGFRDISVVRRSLESRFASPKAFVTALAAGGPSARHALEQLDAEGLRQVIGEVTRSLARYVDDKGVRIITTEHVAFARA